MVLQVVSNIPVMGVTDNVLTIHGKILPTRIMRPVPNGPLMYLRLVPLPCFLTNVVIA